jgi:acyl-CoA dehydrogenase
MDRNYVEGHGVVRFNDLRLPASAVLGEVGQALRYAQMRLAPARLTHCMRWLGAASRAQSIAVRHARERTAFGKTLGEHQGVSFMLADNEIALQQCRLGIWWACWTLDKGDRGTGRHESSMVKAYVSEELFKVADRCVQILGGIGISDETPVGMIFPPVRRPDRGAQVRDRAPGAPSVAASRRWPGPARSTPHPTSGTTK